MLNMACRVKLSKIIPLLGSDSPGEVVSSVRAINEVLANNGSNLHELASVLVSPYSTEPGSSLRELTSKVGLLTVQLSFAETDKQQLQRQNKAQSQRIKMLWASCLFLFMLVLAKSALDIISR